MTATATKIDWSSLLGVILEGGYELQDALDGRDYSAKVRVRILGSGGKTGLAYFLYLATADADDQQDIWQTLRDAPHPNLNRPVAVGRREVCGFDTVYMVLADPDEKLAAVVPERPLEWEEAAEVLHSCEKGLAHLHAHGLIHGSLSPQTVEAVGYTVLLSTESVRRLGKKPRVEWRTPQYLAPESVGANLTTATDVWCLGATLIEVLTQAPYRADGAELDRGLPLAAVIQRCIDMNPATRCTLKEAPALENAAPVAEPPAVVEPEPPATIPQAIPSPGLRTVEPPPPARPVNDRLGVPKTSTSSRSAPASRIPQPLTPKEPPRQITKEELALVPVAKRHKKVQKRQPVGARIRTLDGPIGDDSGDSYERSLVPSVAARTLAVGSGPRFLRNVIAGTGLAILFVAAVWFIIIPKLQSTEQPLANGVSAQTATDTPIIPPNPLAAQPSIPLPASASTSQTPTDSSPPAPLRRELFRVVVASFTSRSDAIHELQTLSKQHPELILRIAVPRSDDQGVRYFVTVGDIMNRNEAEPLVERLINKGLKSAHLVPALR
jgi:serine/threonine protein kinase